MKRPIVLLIFLFLIILGLSILQVIVSNSYATTGIFVDNLDDQIRVYKEENAKIKEELLIASSYNEISSKASVLGFLDKKSEIYLNTPLPLAVKP